MYKALEMEIVMFFYLIAELKPHDYELNIEKLQCVRHKNGWFQTEKNWTIKNPQKLENNESAIRTN